ncbi:unnamed protein product [Urochloa humidicola]
MGGVEQHLRNATSTTLFHQLTDLWRSPRGTVLRIEALVLLDIILCFLIAVFGSSRRSSNRWIVQKGFLAAQALSLSLGAYSIGLMQSSSVKSEMYSIWAVSLLTFFGCVDPVTSYVSVDYKAPLLKMVFQLCLYCGYVLVISVSTISGVVGKLAIGVLSAVTFIKGFHKSLALVLPSTTRNDIRELVSHETRFLVGDDKGLIVHLPIYLEDVNVIGCVTMADIHKHMGKLQLPEVTTNGLTIKDMCLGYSLSHFMQRHFLGLNNSQEMEEKLKIFESLVGYDGCLNIDYAWTLKVIEVELAFLYEVYFSSNEFLHFYQANTGSFWAFTSFIGICFVGVAVAIPGTMASRHYVTSGPTGAGTMVVDTTTADLIITLAVLVSLALLQLVQLMRCWTSNWARVAFACEYTAKRKSSKRELIIISGWMRLKAFVVTRMNWFDKDLWQDGLGQYSVVDVASSRMQRFWDCFGSLFLICRRSLVKTGAAYILMVLWELLGSDTNRVATIRLHDDVKASVTDFLGQIKSRRIGVEWSSLFVEKWPELDPSCLTYSNSPLYKHDGTAVSEAYAFTLRVMMWHIATCYCEQAEPEQSGNRSSAGGVREKNRRVAIALSKYCAYLVVSAPELLPGHPAETKRAFDDAARSTRRGMHKHRVVRSNGCPRIRRHEHEGTFETGVYLGRRLRNEEPPPSGGRTRRRHSGDPWEVLALMWVQTLLYAAPYGNVEAHMQHLSQGGEFITHLWALLYHIGIDRWERDAAAEATKQEEEEEAEIDEWDLAVSSCWEVDGDGELQHHTRRKNPEV